MKSLQKVIFDTIEDRDDLTISHVAKLIGASKQCMNKLKNESTIGFRKLLRLSYLLFEPTQKETMSRWCIQLTSVENIKQSFEYAAITRDIPLLGNLISKHKKETGTIGDYVSIYTIIYGYMKREISGLNLTEKIEEIKQPKDKSLLVLIKIVECYNLFFEKEFLLMKRTAQVAMKMIAKLNDDRDLFMKECFLHRISEVLGPVNLHLNNLKLARYYASIIINADVCAKTVSDAAYIVGMTYLIEDDAKCVEQLQKSYEISKKVGELEERDARLNLDFAKLYLEIEIDKDSHPALISYQNGEASEKYLVEEASYQEIDEDFLILFEAIASKSTEKLYDCFERFLDQTNVYFASLAAKEIQKLEGSSFITNKLIYLKLGQEGDVILKKTLLVALTTLTVLTGVFAFSLASNGEIETKAGIRPGG